MRPILKTAALSLLVLAVLARPGFADNCLQDEFSLQNSQSLNCTANDVRVAKVINIRKLDGTPLTSCEPGTFSFVADFLVQTSSKSSRSNVGLYFSLNDVNVQPTALAGTCSDNIISPQHTCAGGSATCGSSHYEEFDTDTPSDNCGDTSSSDPTVCLNSSNQVVACPAPAGGSTWPGTQIITARIDNFPCTAPQGTTQLVLPNCTSWQVPGKTLLCESSSPEFPYSPNAIPGSPSKCNCSTIPLGITVQSPSVTVAKACSIPGANPAQDNLTACDITPEGGTVVYTVTVTNSSNFGSVTVDQICDNRYGNIFTVNGYSGPACAGGTIGTINSTTCSAMTVVKGTPQSCTFTVTQDENVSITDTVTVSGHGASSGTFGPTSSNTVTVVSHEAPSTATITKGLVSTTNGCATVRYEASIRNTSAAGTDEIIHVNGLTDSGFGDITKWTGTGNSSILGTTCGVATNASGLGTLSGSSGAGTLPATLQVNGGEYKCRFDAQFCSALGTIVSTPGTCTNGACSAGLSGACTVNADCNVTCNGIQHTNTVSSTVTDDDNEQNVVTVTNGTLTVSECFTSSAH